MSKDQSQLFWYPGHDLLIKDISRAENCYLFDSNGKRYLDLESGVWCTSIGHSNPRILNVISEQSLRIAHTGFGYSSGILEEAAYEVLSLLGFDPGKCVFLCSGSESVEFGVRVAQSLIDQPLMMTMSDSYFGAYGSASMREKEDWFIFDWFPCSSCPYNYECNDQCEHWASIPCNEIGGFLFEPGSSSGLVRFPPEKLIRNIAAMVKGNNGLVLINEVTTGVGRTGKWFGFQHYHISPDIVALGKGIGNGYPVSVTAFHSNVIRRMKNKEIKYAQSHQNDPLGAAVAMEVIRVIKDQDLIAKGREIAAILLPELKRIKDSSDRIEEIRSRGLMIAIEFKDDPQNTFTIKIHEELLNRGFILGRRPSTSVLRLDPSLTIDQIDIKHFLVTFETILIENN